MNRGAKVVLLDTILSSSDDSDSDMEEIEFIFKNVNYPKESRPRVINLMENVIYAYHDEEFKRHFRMHRSTFYFLLDILKPHLKNINNDGPVISAEKQLYITLYVLATPDSYRSVVTKFNIGNATAWRAVKRVVRALCQLRNFFIRWPTLEEVEATSNAIAVKYGFPGVIGIVDGTHVRIAAPKENSNAYVNRKGFHSIQLQVICNEKMEFIHCYAGMPGSVHDMRSFKYSGVQQRCMDNYFGNKHLIGDSAYTIQKCVMVPYKDNGHLSLQETHFNHVLSRSRIIVERAIGLLKGRWRFLLDKLPMRRTDLIPFYIIACTVLHNVCLLRGDEISYPILVMDDVEDQGPLEITREQKEEGVCKRDEIKSNLYSLRNV
ncbi:uncharacterized protein [Prorops nasuta]|uniref:uncharacterized protein n=1 Tax=Prorops nasuta TaxID=863751 RepID=UPI0034CD662C